MKIVTYVLGALLAAALVAAALFYFMTFTPMAEDYARMKEGMPEAAKARAELKKYKEKESQQAKELAWTKPALGAASAAFADEIQAGKAEVLVDGNSLVINITENELYTPESDNFAPKADTRSKLAALLRKDELRGRDIFVGNMTAGVPSRGKGKKQIPARDALTLGSERSADLVKYLVKEGAPGDSIAAVAYPAAPDRGFKIKDRKTMIVIGTYPAVIASGGQKQEAGSPKPSGAVPAAAAPQTQPKTLPIKPAQPKTKP